MVIDAFPALIKTCRKLDASLFNLLGSCHWSQARAISRFCQAWSALLKPEGHRFHPDRIASLGEHVAACNDCNLRVIAHQHLNLSDAKCVRLDSFEVPGPPCG